MVLRLSNQIATVQFVLPESDMSVSEVPFIGCKSSLTFAPTFIQAKMQQRSFTAGQFISMFVVQLMSCFCWNIKKHASKHLSLQS